MVRQSDRSVLKDASISQFLTRFWTSEGREVAGWEVRDAEVLGLVVRSFSIILLWCCFGEFERGGGGAYFLRRIYASWSSRVLCHIAILPLRLLGRHLGL
jgi:hypothetical protein